MIRVGSLCTGYGGLDLAVEHVFGGRTIWTADIDKHASKVIAARFPDAPNLGDIKKINWADVPEVDVITGGYPCQPFSHAGKRGGADDERHIWPWILEGVRALRPRWCVFENVGGHLSLGLGDVLKDLAEAGYLGGWCSLRAAEVGAPHGRLRVFILAVRADAVADTVSVRFDGSGTEGRPGGSLGGWGDVAGSSESSVSLLPTPDASAHKYRIGGGSQQSRSLEALARRGELDCSQPQPLEITRTD